MKLTIIIIAHMQNKYVVQKVSSPDTNDMSLYAQYSASNHNLHSLVVLL